MVKYELHPAAHLLMSNHWELIPMLKSCCLYRLVRLWGIFSREIVIGLRLPCDPCWIENLITQWHSCHPQNDIIGYKKHKEIKSRKTESRLSDILLLQLENCLKGRGMRGLKSIVRRHWWLLIFSVFLFPEQPFSNPGKFIPRVAGQAWNNSYGGQSVLLPLAILLSSLSPF